MSIGEVQWDCSTNRPIVDGKTINPETGAVQPASKPITYGPPTIDVKWVNLHSDRENNGWILNGGPAGPSMDKLFIRIGRLVQDGHITLHSVTATRYSFVILCESTLTDDEFYRVRNIPDSALD